MSTNPYTVEQHIALRRVSSIAPSPDGGLILGVKLKSKFWCPLSTVIVIFLPLFSDFSDLTIFSNFENFGLCSVSTSSVPDITYEGIVRNA